LDVDGSTVEASMSRAVDWVLDLVEGGPPAGATPVPGAIGTLLFDVERARAAVAFVVWPGEPKTIGFVEIVGY
jgi:hypothetical protein